MFSPVCVLMRTVFPLQKTARNLLSATTKDDDDAVAAAAAADVDASTPAAATPNKKLD